MRLFVCLFVLIVAFDFFLFFLLCLLFCFVLLLFFSIYFIHPELHIGLKFVTLCESRLKSVIQSVLAGYFFQCGVFFLPK